MLVVTKPPVRGDASQKCHPSRGGLSLLLFNNTIGVFARSTRRASPTHCLHPFPILNQNNNATQKLVLKLQDCLLHILHLLIEVSGDIKLLKKACSSPPSMQNHEDHSFTLEAYFAPPIHPYIDPYICMGRGCLPKGSCIHKNYHKGNAARGSGGSQ